MIQKAETLVMTFLLVGLYCTAGRGQVPPTTILTIDVENFVNYRGDVSDVTKLATDPNITTPAIPRNFYEAQLIGDIVAVNGQPAKGTNMTNVRGFDLSTNPHPGQAISDTVRHGIVQQNFEIQRADGTPLGSIIVAGAAAGPPPPGAPLSVRTANNAIIGGTGAFLGARGQSGQVSQTIPTRDASMAEDPANRRRYGGGRVRFVLHVIPLFRPEVVMTPNGPAVTHSNDFTLVSSSRPAAPGEILSLFATGLGPIDPSVDPGTPGVDPGMPFPQHTLHVNSPVEVKVSGRPAEVLAAVGYPGAVDGYQVNFRLPPDTARGTATIQVTTAWIAGSEVRIAVQ
jgi:uncharacterized protein (TIGR03437 family)